MLAYGYEVEGSPEALADVSENLKDRRSCINWFNFNTGEGRNKSRNEASSA